MRPFAQLDPASLKAFYYASEQLNFTRAAEAAALTQSGVSQHVRKLEEELGTALFLRQQKKVLLTEAGLELRKFVESYLDGVEALREKLSQHSAGLRGIVRYAMPDSCLFTPHFPLLLKERMKSLRGIDLRVKITSSEDVVDLLQKGEIDFGFVNKRLESRGLVFEEFAREEYVLVSSRRSDLEIASVADLRDLKFVSYPGMDALLDHWLESEFPRARLPRLKELQISGEISSLKGAIAMVEHGLGVGIFQKHCVADELAARSLHAYSPRSSRRAENPVFLVTPVTERLPARVQAIVDVFWSMK